MELLTTEIRNRLPKLGGTKGQEDPVVQVKLFSRWHNWTWYVTEFDGDDVLFGFSDGAEREWSHFNLAELRFMEGPFGLRAVRRDRRFKPTPISKLGISSKCDD